MALPLHASASPESDARMHEGVRLFNDADYLKASRYFFSVYTDPTDSREEGELLGYITESLIRGGFKQTAAYFYIKTLKSGSRGGIRRISRFLPQMVDAVGVDLLKTDILAHSREGDYDSGTLSHFYYFLGKDKLLKGESAAALESLRKVNLSSSIGAQAALLRAAAHAILGQNDQAIEMFRSCERSAGRLSGGEGEDLEHRCIAGRARTLYQMGRHDDADEIYDEIPKKSFVWTDILFEQAWNAYAKDDYNRALGKLVTYRSPHLKFVFNPEIEVLQAQSFLALCLFDDANKVINEFNASYQGVGHAIKGRLQSSAGDFAGLYALGKSALRSKLHTTDGLRRALNRSVRGSHFAAFVRQEAAAAAEGGRIKAQIGASGGYPDFLEKVVAWRSRTARLLGGVFVRNSLVDLYNDLLSNLDKMSFIKSEMLSQMKSRIERRASHSEDENGVMKRGRSGVERRDYQYFWSFNGEFWSDELGDYVFALDSECR